MSNHFWEEHQVAIDWLTKSIAASLQGSWLLRKAYTWMGVSQYRLNNPEQALETFSAGLEAVGDDPEIRFEMARVLTGMGRFAEAREQYERMNCDLSGQLTGYDKGILGPKRLHNLGEVCMALQDYLAARNYLREAIALSWSGSAHYLLEIALERDDFRTATEAVRGLEAIEGESEAWAVAFCRLAAARGDDPEASLWQVLRRNPNAVGPNLLLSRYLLERGDVGRAVPTLELLDALGQGEGPFKLGLLAADQGDLETAAAYLARALELNPGHVQTLEQIERIGALNRDNE